MLLHGYYIIITYYYIIHYYVLLHFVLLHCYCIIITKSLLRIITLLLHYYYVIITSLLPMAEKGNNGLIITYYAFSVFSELHCYYPLLLLLPIITCTHYPLLHVTNRATCR